ncbi:MAG: ABC transporter permease [Clostridiales bacterium]|nr:ABC transporter permease [Clostridiales bacterium]
MKYVLKKTGLLLVSLLLISVLAFLAFSVIPGDPATKILGTQYTPERAEQLREELGLNRSLVERYLSWLSDFVRGDPGTSYNYFIPVREVLSGKIQVTVALSLISWLIIVLTGLPLGVFMAKEQRPRLGRFGIVSNQVVMAVPPFFMGILLTYFFGLILKLFTPGNFPGFEESLPQTLFYLLFPALAIALPKAAGVAKMLRSSILKEMRLDYVRTAYSRGNSRWDVIKNHVLRNAMLPVITFLAMTMADAVAGSIIVEQVFALPGLGRLLLASIGNRDYPVAQCIVVMIAALVVFMNYLADIISQYVDPRVRLN